MADPTAQPEAAAPPAAPAPRIAGGPERFKTIPLRWPVHIDGVVHDQIIVTRMTVAEVAKFERETSERAKTEPDGRVRMPMFRWATDGRPVADAEFDVMDDDDLLAAEEVAVSFLPRRYRGATVNASAQPDGAHTAPLLEKISDGR
jgi:hypothetical protein